MVGTWRIRIPLAECHGGPRLSRDASAAFVVLH